MSSSELPAQSLPDNDPDEIIVYVAPHPRLKPATHTQSEQKTQVKDKDPSLLEPYAGLSQTTTTTMSVVQSSQSVKHLFYASSPTENVYTLERKKINVIASQQFSKPNGTKTGKRKQNAKKPEHSKVSSKPPTPSPKRKVVRRGGKP